MATWRSGIGILACVLAGHGAWAAPADWTRIASDRSIDPDSPEQREVRDWLRARGAPGSGAPDAVRLGVTRVFPGQSPAAATASGALDRLFPPVATDGNQVRILSCSSGREEWSWRASGGQWVLQHYAVLADAPCDVGQPLAAAAAGGR